MDEQALVRHQCAISIVCCQTGWRRGRHSCCVGLQIFTKRIKQGVWDIRAIVDSGGMPSSHSALCTVGYALKPAEDVAWLASCFPCSPSSMTHQDAMEHGWGKRQDQT